jgi:hypothetical protein
MEQNLRAWVIDGVVVYATSLYQAYRAYREAVYGEKA